MWLKTFCTDEKLRKELGALIDADNLGDNLLDKLDLENVKRQIRIAIKALEEKLHTSFNYIRCENDMNEWKDKPHELLKLLVGCTEQCPFCGEQCDLMESNHFVPHRVMIHRSVCFAGYKTKILDTECCPCLVSSDGKFKNQATNQVSHPYKEYQKIYPNWSIPPDVTAGDSLYWMLFISKFKDDLAKRYEAKLPDVPEHWGEIKWPEVEENLKKIYNL